MIAESAMIVPAQSLRELNNSIAPSVALRTIQRRLREKEIEKYRQRKKPPLSSQHHVKRLAWALEQENWTEEWKNVVWCDECSIQLGSGQGRPYVFWLQGNEMLDTDGPCYGHPNFC
jgi:hypothetical protein